MSDSDESRVTYTEISSPFEGLSDIGSPRADDHEYLELPWMPEDPYMEAALQAPPSPDYVPGPEEPEQAPPSPDYVPGPEHTDDEIVAEDQPDAEDCSPLLEEEEHPAPADSVVVALPATDQAPSAEETESFETDESAATPPHTTPPYVHLSISRISIPAPHPPTQSPLPHSPIPSPSLPLSPLLLVLSPAPPPSPIRSLGYRAAMIRMRAEAASTSHSLPLPPTFILSPTRPDAPSLRYHHPCLYQFLLHHHHCYFPLLVIERTDPRLPYHLGRGYEVGESSSAAARPAGGLRADYGFVATIDKEIRRDPKREMETEAKIVREAWRRSMDASDLARGEVMSLRYDFRDAEGRPEEIYRDERVEDS
ncbi:hypothetical protein Tco_1351868 [Tanacetum coccineum]